eukprot:4440319-Amphidinium_carterae.1
MMLAHDTELRHGRCSRRWAMKVGLCKAHGVHGAAGKDKHAQRKEVRVLKVSPQYVWSGALQSRKRLSKPCKCMARIEVTVLTKVLGDCVNMAKNLMKEAFAHGILCDEETSRPM